jgi:hypothetical protein
MTESESVFDRFRGLGDGIVDIEVRHSLPFRLVLKRRHKELV